HTTHTKAASPPRYPLFPYSTLFRSYQMILSVAGTVAVAVNVCRGSCAHSCWSPPLTGAGGAGSTVSVTLPTPLQEAVLTVSTYRSEEHTSELQSRENLVCRLLLETR